jgi:2-polyprenyl-6-methoxyphenol hydroxylase-like FAD-dependent oxidoreductase
VTGVQLDSGARHVGDLVIDATGRRSPTLNWLDEIGAAAPVGHSEDSGFSYTGRYYRARPDESADATCMPMLAPYGSFSILTLPADADTRSVTLHGMSDDRPLRQWRDPEIFENVVRACPPQAHWVKGEPISDISTMAGVVDRHREFVVDGMPCATGILSIADASSCTNPSLGRGITLGLMHAEVMRSCVRDHVDDLDALAMSFHERTTEHILPFQESTTKIDRRRVEEMRIYREGGTPERTDDQKFAHVLGAAVGIDETATDLVDRSRTDGTLSVIQYEGRSTRYRRPVKRTR